MRKQIAQMQEKELELKEENEVLREEYEKAKATM
jgi:hypothetical protein